MHKSQGSEYPAVVIPLATQHYSLLERNLLYTAVTRGRRLVVVIGQVKAPAIAVKRVESVKRLTYLRQRLAGIGEGVRVGQEGVEGSQVETKSDQSPRSLLGA